MSYCIYWIHLPWHTDMFREGYIGVTAELRKKRRLSEHQTYKQNKHLAFAFTKYGDAIVQSIVLVGSKEYCQLIEERLRSRPDIGWNIAKGGGIPPSWKGRKRSSETVAKRAADMKGKIPNFHGHLPHNTPQWRAQHDKRMKENNPSKGKPVSEEMKFKQNIGRLFTRARKKQHA